MHDNRIEAAHSKPASFAVDVKGVWHCCKAVAPAMREQKSGSIVNIASVAVAGQPGTCTMSRPRVRCEQ